MSSYCDRHGHEYGKGNAVCLNCGADARTAPITTDPAEVGELVQPARNPEGAALVDAFQGDGKPNTKPSNPLNPKDAIGQGKLPMHLVPTAVTRYAALAFAEGALKYGKYNWRVAGVRMSIYLDALHRHLAKLQDGEWADGDSLGPDAEGNPQGTGVPHLASIIACSGIILDAWECAKLTDDRPPVNAIASENTDMGQKHIAHLKALFATYTPHQHTIADARPAD